MALSEQTERAVEACRDAVLMPALWPDALQQLADSLGAASCTFFGHDPSPFTVPISSAHREFADLWLRNEGHAPDPFMTRKACRTGSSYVIESQILTEEEHRTLPYFHETARPGKRDWYASACFSVGDHPWALPVYRDAARGPFTHEEGRYFAELGPHLGEVIAMAEKFADVRVASALAALGHLKCAALVIDSRGVARYLNRLAENLLGKDFNLHFGRLVTRDPASNRRLQQLISSILTARHGRSTPALNQVVIDRGETPWRLLETMPVTAPGSDVFSEGRAILMLTDLTGSATADSTLLAVLFGLTAAEAKLAACIASGSGIDKAAAALSIGRETARSQLKAVFLKTNARCQAELVALISRLRPVVRQ